MRMRMSATSSARASLRHGYDARRGRWRRSLKLLRRFRRQGQLAEEVHVVPHMFSSASACSRALPATNLVDLDARLRRQFNGERVVGRQASVRIAHAGGDQVFELAPIVGLGARRFLLGGELGSGRSPRSQPGSLAGLALGALAWNFFTWVAQWYLPGSAGFVQRVPARSGTTCTVSSAALAWPPCHAA